MTSVILQWIFALCVLTGSGRGQPSVEAGIGNCPAVTSVTDFDISKFSGTWFIGYQFQKTFHRCTTLLMDITPENNFKVQVTSEVGPYNTIDAGAKAFAPNKTSPAVMNWIWDALPGYAEHMTVVETDYTNYAIVLFCSNFALFHNKKLVILTRNRDNDQKENIEKAKTALAPFFPVKEDAMDQIETECVSSQENPDKRSFSVDKTVSELKEFLKMMTDVGLRGVSL